MTSTWLPPAAAWLLSAAFLVVGAVHVRHLVRSGVHHPAATEPTAVRAWHAGHVLMAAGMVAMTLPVAAAPPAAVAVPLLAAAGLTAAVVAGRAGRRSAPRTVRRSWAWCWWVLAVDQLVMAYMWTVTPASPAWLTLVAGGWLALEAGLWSVGALPGRAAAPASATPPDTVSASAGPPAPPVRAGELVAASGIEGRAAGAGSDGDPGRSVRGGAPGAPGAPGVRTAGSPGPREAARPGLAITMVVMALGAAYMLLAMQFGQMASPMGPTTTGRVPTHMSDHMNDHMNDQTSGQTSGQRP